MGQQCQACGACECDYLALGIGVKQEWVSAPQNVEDSILTTEYSPVSNMQPDINVSDCSTLWDLATFEAELDGADEKEEIPEKVKLADEFQKKKKIKTHKEKEREDKIRIKQDSRTQDLGKFPAGHGLPSFESLGMLRKENGKRYFDEEYVRKNFPEHWGAYNVGINIRKPGWMEYFHSQEFRNKLMRDERHAASALTAESMLELDKELEELVR